MYLIIKYIQGFLKRAGNYVFLATVISRGLSLLTSLCALQFIDNTKLGVVLYAWNIITFLIPFAGFGLSQSLIRYGASLTTENKKHLLQYVVKNGTFASFFLSIAVALFGLLYNFEFEETGTYITLFSTGFIPIFLLETIKIQLRLEHKNKTFALVDIIYSITFFLLVLLLSYLFQQNGYIASLLLTPTLISIFFFSRIKTKKTAKKDLEISIIEFWKYGFFGSLSNVVTMLLFAIDILLIGTILEDSVQITNYRYLSLIPFSLLFLPRVFINTDFVTFTEKISSKEYIKNYIKSYLILFTSISFILILFFYTLNKEILNLLDPSFIKYSETFLILNVGICGILIFRGLFGNLLSSIGLVKANFYISLIALIINYFSNKKLIVIYGIKGAAITSAGLMWLTGITSAIVFFFGYKKFLSTFKKL